MTQNRHDSLVRPEYGTDAGVKHDYGKPRCGLVLGGFARALMEVSKVGTMGAQKYTPNGWVLVENGEERYEDAGMRHYLQSKCEEERDEESELYHRSHEAWNALAKLDLFLRRKEEEEAVTTFKGDRPCPVNFV